MTSANSGHPAPPPDTLAGHLWTVGDAAGIDQLVTSAAEGLALPDGSLSDLRLYAKERSAGIQTLAEALGQPEDEPELYTTIASLWLELRFEWQRHNEVMNYAAVRETPLPQVASHGSVCSAILERLENLLLPHYRDKLDDQAIRLLEAIVPSQYPAIGSPSDSGPPLPQPATLAGAVWAAGDPAAIDATVTAAVASMDLSNDELVDLRHYAAQRSSGIQILAKALGEPEDEEELYTTIASLWLELRLEWQRDNEVMNYAAVRGNPLPAVASHGSVCSAILERLEGLLLPEYRAQLADHAIRLLEDILTP
jgi:hypothetical protein